MAWIKLKEQQLSKQKWNLKDELAKANYKIKKEQAHKHTCPYCGFLNRGRKYYPKLEYTKCENCGRLCINRCHG